MNLEDAIEALKKSLSKAKVPAEFEVRIPDEVKAENEFLPLSDELITFYGSFTTKDIVVPWSVEILTVYSSTTLFSHQVGYRYLDGDEPNTVVEWWDASWVVIADHSADPVIAHTDKPETPISMAVHGAGFWKPQLLAPNLTRFLQVLSIWVDIGIVKYDGRVFDEQSHFRAEIANDLRENISNVVEDNHITNFFEFVGVWPI